MEAAAPDLQVYVAEEPAVLGGLDPLGATGAGPHLPCSRQLWDCCQSEYSPDCLRRWMGFWRRFWLRSELVSGRWT